MSDNVSAEQLRLLIERVERLESEKQGISDDIKDVYAEAKATGWDVPAMRKLIAMRKKRQDERTHEEGVLATYAAALGMQLGFDI